MNGIDILIAVIVLVVVILAVRHLIGQKKSGKCAG